MFRRFAILGCCGALLAGITAPDAAAQTANLAVTIQGVPTVATMGSNVTYTMMVTNIGPGAAANVRLTNALPPGFTFVSGNINVGGSSTQTVVLIATNKVWRYDDTGTDRGTAWIEPGYDDSAWRSGAGALANDDNYTATWQIPTNTWLRLNDSGGTRIKTYYFRTTFDPGVSISGNPTLRMRYQLDDGMVVYLNGLEIYRTNMPASEIITNGSLALAAHTENVIATKDVVVTNLVAGTNSLAVEVHQSSATSSDIYFGMGVDIITSAGPTTSYTVENGTNVVFSISSLPAASSATAVVVARTGSPGTYAPRAMVGSATTDNILGNNSAQGATIVNAPTPANLSLELTDFPDPIQISNVLTYTLTISNAGPAAAVDTVLTNLLSDGVEFVSATISNAGLVTQMVQFLSFSNVWKYDDSNTDLGTNWIDPAFDDSVWLSGPGVLGEEPDPLPYPLLTPLPNFSRPTITYYFRSTFDYAGAATNRLQMRFLVDDGAVFYLNGREFYRTNMPAGAIAFSTFASSATTNISEGKLHSVVLALTNLVSGVNTLAVEVHQNGTNSSDVAFGIELSEVITSPGAYQVDGQQIVFSLGRLLSLNTAQILLNVRPIAAGLLTNAAVVGSSIYDANLANNVAETTTLVATGPVGADLSVTVTDTPDPIIQGQNLTYQITVRSAGPAPAANTRVTNNFLLPIEAVNLPPNCTLVGNSVICSLGTIASEAQASVSFTVRPLQSGILTNVVVAVSSEVDASPLNNVALATTVVETSLRADLAVTVQDFPDPVIAGELFTNVITITNPGWSNAPNVSLTNRLTGPLTITKVTVGSGGTATNLGNGVVVCSLGMVPVGSNVTVVIEAQALAVGYATNVANVGSDILDPNLANNYSLTTTRINPTPVVDLVTTIAINPDPPYGNFPMLYSIHVVNAGTLAASGVVLTNWIPPQVTVVGITNVHGAFTNLGNQLICQLGALPIGASATVLVQVVTPPEGTLTNIAAAVSAQTDFNVADNVAVLTSVAVPVTAADISLTVTPLASNLYAGEELTLRLNLVNNGPLTATGVVITNYLPAGVAYLRGNATRGSIALASNAVVLILPPLTNGASMQASLVMRPIASGALTNLAIASGDQPDPTPNVVATVFQVRPSADLQISVEESSDPASSKALLIYSITAVNAGPSTASNTTIYCYLPPMAEFKGSFPVAGVSSANGVVVWNAGALAPGGYATLEVEFIPGEVPQLMVPVGVYSDAHDPVPTNNTTVVQTAVLVSLAGTEIFITPTINAGALAAALTASGATGLRVNNVALQAQRTQSRMSSGLFTASSIYGNGQQLSGVIMSTGDVRDYASGPNTSDAREYAYNRRATREQEALLDPITSGGLEGYDHYDVTQLDIYFDVLPGYDAVTFKVIFGSEEYPEFVGSPFVDGFGIYLDGTNIAYATGFPVNIDHPDMVATPGTELDGVIMLGGTNAVMTFSASLAPGTTGHRLTFILADTSDAKLDTTVYIASLEGALGATADLEVFASAVPDPVMVGQPLTYTLMVTNHGLSVATNTVLTGLFPDIFDNVTVSLSQGTHTWEDGVLVWTVGDLARRGGAVATVTGTPTFDARIIANFSAESEVTDIVPTNNFTQVLSTITDVDSFYSPSALTIRDGAAALPYPSTITVAGINGVVDSVTVAFLGLYHTFPADLHALVMSPDGRAVLLMAGAGGGFDAESVNIRFSDSATQSLPLDAALATGIYKPTNLAATNEFPGLAYLAAPSFSTSLATFRRANPNGEWRLYLYDAQGGDVGELAGGWNIRVTPTPEMSVTIAGANIVVSWHDLPGYTLEGAATLSPNPVWTTVNEIPAVADGRATVTVPLSSGLKFFRLRK